MLRVLLCCAPVAIAASAACATPVGPPAARATRFSPSAKLKVLFVDLEVSGVSEADARRAGDLFAAALVEAQQAEVLYARDLPDLREESARRAWEGERSPAILGRRAAELGADVAVTGLVARLAGGAWAVAVHAVDAAGRLADGQGAKVAGDFAAVEIALRAKGGSLLRPIPPPVGPPSTSDAARVLSARAGLFDRCYAFALRRVRGLVGRGVLEVRLEGGSEAADVKVAMSSFNDAGVEACFAQAVRGLVFPILPGTTTLRFPVAYVE